MRYNYKVSSYKHINRKQNFRHATFTLGFDPMRESKGAGGLLNVHDKIIAYMPRTPSRKHSSSPPLPHKKFSGSAQGLLKGTQWTKSILKCTCKRIQALEMISRPFEQTVIWQSYIPYHLRISIVIFSEYKVNLRQHRKPAY